MANRIFTSFAIEDRSDRDLFVGQARNKHTPWEIIDMSVKEPWDEKWKTNCRIRIRGCDGVIALVSKHTLKAAGQLWEVKCAREEGIPILGLYVSTTDRPWLLPAEFNGVRVVDWTWDNIFRFTNEL